MGSGGAVIKYLEEGGFVDDLGAEALGGCDFGAGFFADDEVGGLAGDG